LSAKFACKGTGSCCSHIRGFVGEDDKKFFEEFAYGRLPLVQLMPIERTSFPLWDWEAKRFRNAALRLNIEPKIIPSRAVYDQNENRTIIVTYSIDSDACTFLQEGKCAIYNERAFICRLFPFQKSPFLKTNEEFSAESLFGGCPAISGIVPNIPGDFREMISFLHESFNSTFLSAVENDYVTSWINRTIIDLMKKKAMMPAMNHPYKFLIKRMENSEKIDLTDFLVEKAIYSRFEMEEIINSFESNVHANSRLKEVLYDFNSTNETP